MPALLPQERTTIKDFLVERFNLTELEDIAFDLSISYQSLPHNTSEQLAREMFLYCERRSILEGLVLEIFRRRTDAQHTLGKLMGKLGFGSPRTKVQIIVPADALIISEEQLANIIAKACQNVRPGDVAILATAPDSNQALVGLPVQAADTLIQSFPNKLSSSIHQVVAFESLSVEHQKNWRAMVVNLKPEQTRVIKKAGNFVVQETIYTAQQVINEGAE